jgi:hypothetical protein
MLKPMNQPVRERGQKDIIGTTKKREAPDNYIECMAKLRGHI